MDFPKLNGATPDGAAPNGAGITTNGGRHGQAALLLVESLMHFMVSKGTLSREDFIEIVDVAADAECGAADPERSSLSDYRGSLLYPLAAAFRREFGR